MAGGSRLTLEKSPAIRGVVQFYSRPEANSFRQMALHSRMAADDRRNI